jgi:8-oxo-dGTP pyrophosphatase MutT (NUDIX family)
MEKQFTATVYLFHENRVLLHLHAKLRKWLPPGGHLEPNETPPEAARREVREETGLEIVFIEQENLKVNAYNGVSIERPFLCLLENIPAHKDKPAHQHIDMIYLARPVQLHENLNDFRWFSYEELQELELFPDVQEVLRLLLKENGLNRLQPEEPFIPLS